MNIFVGNLSFEVREIDVQRAFSAFGVVTSVVIVMEKKGKKSRGFGFVEMPDEQEALAAIAQLQDKEILGRPINVMPSVSKEPKSKDTGRNNKHQRPSSGDNSAEKVLGESGRNARQDLDFKRTGKYREGRRSISYLKRKKETGATPSFPERKYKSNPLRWRKKPRWTAPSTKPEGELKPWQRPQTESNPWKKPRPKTGSWKKPEGESKPWQRGSQSESKPWGKNRSGTRPEIKAEGSQSKPWKKTASPASGTWKRSGSEGKPWSKNKSADARPRFKKRARLSQR